MKIFLDTNIYVRYFIKDDENKFNSIVNLFEQIENSKIKPYTSNIVLLELNYVLSKTYKLDKAQVLVDIQTIIKNTRNLTVIEETDTEKALEIAKKHNIKLADALISTQIRDDIKLCTYDNDFDKLDFIERIEPSSVTS